MHCAAQSLSQQTPSTQWLELHCRFRLQAVPIAKRATQLPVPAQNVVLMQSESDEQLVLQAFAWQK